MKKKILLGLVLILCCFTGCSSNGSSKKDDNNPPEIKMSDIDWSVKSGIIDDERKLTFSYKNNTDYTIAYIELTFTRKDSVSDQEMLNAFKQYDNDDYSKNEIKNFNIVTESYRFVKSDQKSNNISCGADDGLWTDLTQDQYNLMTPDNAIIKVIKNRKFYTFNYDFKNKDMILDDSNSDINIYQWSSSDMAKKTLKPNFDCVVVDSDDNAYFLFHGYGVSRRQFETYVEKVKTKFSDIETDDSDIEYFEAKNNNGDEIELSYNASEQEVSCTISNDNVTSGDEDDTESATEATTTTAVKKATTTTAKKVTTAVKKKDTQTSGIRPRIKKAIDSYEKVMDSYCEFMKKYNKSSDTSSMIKDYADYMEKYSDAVEKFQKIKNDNLNSDELSYYTKVQVRVTKKLADIQ